MSEFPTFGVCLPESPLQGLAAASSELHFVPRVPSTASSWMDERASCDPEFPSCGVAHVRLVGGGGPSMIRQATYAA